MAVRLDLSVLPIFRSEGKDRPAFNGIYAAAAPRRVARSRDDDRLVVILFLTGTATFSADGQRQLLEGIAKTYFQTPGAATSALRSSAESFNEFLLDRNLRSASSGLQATGLLTLVALHRERFYLAQSGPTHLYTVDQDNAQHFHDIALSGRGLGLSRAAAIRYLHVPAVPGSLLIVSPDPPSTWKTGSLRDAFGRSIHTIHQGLLRQPPDDILAVVVQATQGRGNIQVLKPLPTPSLKPQAENKPIKMAMTKEPSMPAAEPKIELSPERLEDLLPLTQDSGDESEPPDSLQSEEPQMEGSTVLESEVEPASEPVPEYVAPLTKGTGSDQGTPSLPESLSSVSSDQTEKEKTTEKGNSVSSPPSKVHKPVMGPMLLAVGRAFSAAGNLLKIALRALLTRLLPGNELFTIPRSTMAFIAVAVPVVIVTVASIVYMQRGRQSQFATYLQYAEAAALNAQGKTDPAEQYTAWEAVLFYVEKAEAYQKTDQTQALRERTYQVLDGLDNAERLEFRPAIAGGLPEDIFIHQIVATRDALYMLDSGNGVVYRAWATGLGYELDPTFRCGPGQYGSYIVESLIDIVALPPDNSFGAEIVSMDGNGILIYCIPGKPLLAAPLAPPDSNWGKPRAFTLDNGALFILDPLTNAVWIYRGDDFTFVSRPRLFFSENVPPMADVIDLAVDGNDIFLLHEDGHLTNCTYSPLTDRTECTDPAIFTDLRPGYENGPFIRGASFDQIAFTPPPGPSIYLLDGQAQSIYHFSLRLTFQRQYRAGTTQDTPMTAFAFSPNRELFVAFGNQVMITPLP